MLGWLLALICVVYMVCDISKIESKMEASCAQYWCHILVDHPLKSLLLYCLTSERRGSEPSPATSLGVSPLNGRDVTVLVIPSSFLSR
ncbi:hypothetical protein F4775DRAFT_551444 [Biscogniauxia sp. FL1348]|nr:hypothetical protein F4775DRAFT_551444 [Biscogniauxia sp. FL1348]